MRPVQAPDYLPVGHIDIEICQACGDVKMIAWIEGPSVIEKKLTQRYGQAIADPTGLLATSRAPLGELYG